MEQQKQIEQGEAQKIENPLSIENFEDLQDDPTEIQNKKEENQDLTNPLQNQAPLLEEESKIQNKVKSDVQIDNVVEKKIEETQEEVKETFENKDQQFPNDEIENKTDQTEIENERENQGFQNAQKNQPLENRHSNKVVSENEKLDEENFNQLEKGKTESNIEDTPILYSNPYISPQEIFSQQTSSRPHYDQSTVHEEQKNEPSENNEDEQLNDQPRNNEIKFRNLQNEFDHSENLNKEHQLEPGNDLTISKIENGIAVLVSDQFYVIQLPVCFLPEDVSIGHVVRLSLKRNVNIQQMKHKNISSIQDEILNNPNFFN